MLPDGARIIVFQPVVGGRAAVATAPRSTGRSPRADAIEEWLDAKAHDWGASVSAAVSSAT